jgi:hypothetical protein
VDDFELAERNVLAALFIDSHRSGDRLLDAEELARLYHIHVSEKWFAAIVAELKAEGMVMTYADKESSSAVLVDGGYKAARQRVLEQLGAASFQVDWNKEEILTDAEYPDRYPLPIGWKWLQYDSDNRKPKASPRPIAEVQGTAEAIPLSFATLNPETIVGMPLPTPPPPPPPRRIDWTKWGTIFGGVSVLIALAALVLGAF